MASICGLVCLASCTEYNNFRFIHVVACISTPFIFVDISHLVYWLITWWTFRLLLLFSYYELCFYFMYKFSCDHMFPFLLSDPLGVKLLSNSMFNFLRNHQTFPKQLQHVTAHFQCMMVPISPYLHLLSSVFFYYSHPSRWIMVTLWFWYVFPSLMANDLENFFHVLIWP